MFGYSQREKGNYPKENRYSLGRFVAQAGIINVFEGETKGLQAARAPVRARGRGTGSNNVTSEKYIKNLD